MNSLSWLLYFGGVSESLQGTFLFFACATLLVGVVTIIYGGVCKDDAHESNDTWKRGNRLQGLALKIAPSIALPLFIVSALLPSQNTVYAIAASEMGERALTNPRVVQSTNKAFDALDNWLDAQLATPKVEEKK